ncbi:MAG: hypothetical protein AAGF26_15600 [Cyanobacteria bacterium P01_G01_bin.49]
MNNIQLKIKLVSVNTEYVGQDTKIVVSGKAKFRFYGSGQFETREISYKTYGKTALALQDAGNGSVYVVSGSVNIYKPNDTNPNYTMVLTINQACPVSFNQPEPQSVAQTNSADQEKITF